jgi:hypothetical protein
MDPVTKAAFLDELDKIAADYVKAAKIKSNDRMPPRTKANIAHLINGLQSLPDEHKEEAVKFVERVTPTGLFDIMHSMRRWYSGGTMARKLLEHNDAMSTVMKLEPKDAVGVFRGFKVPNDNPLAKLEVGQRLTLDVTRNHGISSWTMAEAPAHKFSGGGNGKTGLVVKLIDHKGITPILAPPQRTEEWFNALYEKTIGKSFRPKEEEYLIAAPKVRVEVVRVKK